MSQKIYGGHDVHLLIFMVLYTVEHILVTYSRILLTNRKLPYTDKPLTSEGNKDYLIFYFFYLYLKTFKLASHFACH